MKATYKLGAKGKSLIQHFEGCKLKAYKCPAGIWTIGFGNTFYEDNSPVKEGDSISIERANELFDLIVDDFVENVNTVVKSDINQNQFDSLVCICYNIGQSAFYKSTLLKKVNLNPSDPSISDSFLMWNKAKGKVLEGLTKRRIAEGNLYFTK